MTRYEVAMLGAALACVGAGGVTWMIAPRPSSKPDPAPSVATYDASAGRTYDPSVVRFSNVVLDVPVPANTPTLVYAKGSPVSSEWDVYVAFAWIRYVDGMEAVIRRYVSGRLHGGVFCRLDGVCADPVQAPEPTADFDHPLDAYVATGKEGTAAHIVWSGSTLGLQVTCPVACTLVAGGLSNDGWNDSPIIDRVKAKIHELRERPR